jgi:hypothetical protein
MTQLTGPELRAALERGCMLLERYSNRVIQHQLINGKLMHREGNDDCEIPNKWKTSALTLDDFQKGMVTLECYQIVEPNRILPDPFEQAPKPALVRMREYLVAEQASYEARKLVWYHNDVIYQTTTNCALEVLRLALFELDKIEKE